MRANFMAFPDELFRASLPLSVSNCHDEGDGNGQSEMSDAAPLFLPSLQQTGPGSNPSRLYTYALIGLIPVLAMF
jgi:hypothetical protein